MYPSPRAISDGNESPSLCSDTALPVYRILGEIGLGEMYTPRPACRHSGEIDPDLAAERPPGRTVGRRTVAISGGA